MASKGVAQNRSNSLIYRRILSFAVPFTGRARYNSGALGVTTEAHSGERVERTIPWHTAIRGGRWHTAIREGMRRPPGFVERNRGIPQTRRDDSPTLGEAGGDAGTPPPARQDGFGLRLPGGVGRVGPRSESSSSAGEREQCHPA